ncbi:unnamed protein product [Musa acuminata subsp. malaccensis]|uniref:(wild Malaysian banana) hypothetical protein n=1 Tax=Musa acuminata subsp. malaccensis TaxID=214687 RepID=A0A804IQS3_MUSAM|nr:unnamed protein product [Musa acuminata subsp. malaccensis]
MDSIFLLLLFSCVVFLTRFPKAYGLLAFSWIRSHEEPGGRVLCMSAFPPTIRTAFLHFDLHQRCSIQMFILMGVFAYLFFIRLAMTQMVTNLQVSAGHLCTWYYIL